MKGPCMCGDPYCPSCGDPRGHYEEELVYDWLFEVLADIVGQVHDQDIPSDVVEAFGKSSVSDIFREACVEEAKRYFAAINLQKEEKK